MFKILVLSLLFWIILCLTPLGEELEKIVDSWAVKRVEQINKNSDRSIIPRFPSKNPSRPHKW